MGNLARFKRGIFKVRRQHSVDLHLELAAALKAIARECVDGARELQTQDSTAQYILTLHAIELALKSYLASKGFDAKTLETKYGHKLSELYADATKRGLLLNIQDADELLKWGDELNHRASLRYGLEPYQNLPHCSELLRIADGILSNIPGAV